MKTIFSFLLVGLFSLEIMSPFMIGYLNTANNVKNQNVSHNKTNPVKIKSFTSKPIIKNTENVTEINLQEDNFSDSKTFTVKENDMAFNQKMN